MFAALAVAALAFGRESSAMPQFYDMIYEGCKAPSEAFGGHGFPVPTESIVVEVTDETGALVTNWKSRTRYTVTIKAYGSAPVNMWINANTGLFFAPDPNAGAIAAACKQSWYSLGAAESHTTEWQSASSPEDDCAKIVIVQAAGPTDTYRTTEITNFCQSTAAAAPAPVPGMTSVARAPPPVAPPPAPAPMLALGPAPAPKRPDHPGPVTTAPTQTFPTAPPDATPSAEAATDSAPARPSAWTVTSLVMGALAIAVA